MESNHAWAASAAWVGTVFSFLHFHLMSVYFGFLEKTSWKSVVGKVVATCFSFEIFQSWAQCSNSLSFHNDKCLLFLSSTFGSLSISL